MHATLQVPELLQLIFSHISEKNSLNALARTCAAFLEPALACLWARIVTLEPFILLLPESKRRKDKESWITTVDELADNDVARMRFYAPLVRDLDLRNSNSSFEIDGAPVARVAHALCARDARALRAHQDCIFPNLRTFCLVAGYADSLPALLAPSIAELDLILHYRSMGLEELHRTMRILLERIPSVKQLHVVLDYPDNQNHLFRELLAQRRNGIPSCLGDTASPHLSDTIQSLVIDFSHLDTATLHAIAALPNLDHLEVYGGYRAHELGLEEGSDLVSVSSALELSSSSTFDSSSFSNPDSPSSSTLGSSPSLSSSSLPIICSLPTTTTFPPPSPPPRATRLKSLSVDILTEGVLAPYVSGTVLRILNPPALARLTMERILSPGHMRQLCSDIASSSAAQTLTHLTLSGDWSVMTIFPRDLRALYACRNLVDLELVWIAVRLGVGYTRFEAGDVRLEAESVEVEEESVGVDAENARVDAESVRFDEEEIREVGAAWPRLRTFAVRGVDEGDARPPSCSLAGLAAFARYFPNLEELEISVDTSAVLVDTSAFDSSPSHDARIPSTGSADTPSFTSASRLRSLSVGTSQIDAPPAHIAAVLTRCFPRLVPEGLVSVSKRWDIVRRLMDESRRSW